MYCTVRSSSALLRFAPWQIAGCGVRHGAVVVVNRRVMFCFSCATETGGVVVQNGAQPSVPLCHTPPREAGTTEEDHPLAHDDTFKWLFPGVITPSWSGHKRNPIRKRGALRHSRMPISVVIIRTGCVLGMEYFLHVSQVVYVCRGWLSNS